MRLSRSNFDGFNNNAEEDEAQMAQDRQELVRQAAQQHAKELAELPVWQHAFVLGPNVRFTRTPENALPKRLQPETVAATETVSQHEVPMSVGELEQMTAQPFMATMTVDHTPDLTRAYVDAKASQRVSPALLAEALAATAAPGARALVSELQREFSGQAPMSPVPYRDGVQQAAGANAEFDPSQYHAGYGQPSENDVSPAASQSLVSESEVKAAVPPRPVFKPSGLPPLLYKRPVPKPAAETQPVVDVAPSIPATASAVAPITVPPVVASDIRPAQPAEPVVAPSAEPAPAAAVETPRLPSIVNLPDHLLWEVMSLGLAANDDSAAPASVPAAQPVRASARSIAAAPVQAHAAQSFVRDFAQTAQAAQAAQTATMPRAYFSNPGVAGPAATVPAMPQRLSSPTARRPIVAILVVPLSLLLPPRPPRARRHRQSPQRRMKVLRFFATVR